MEGSPLLPNPTSLRECFAIPTREGAPNFPPRLVGGGQGGEVLCPDVYATDILVSRKGTSFTVSTSAGSRKINIPLLGRHQVYAALAVIAVGLARGVDLDTIAGRLAEMPRVPGRLNPLPGRRGSLLLDDSYSASPAAVEAALETLAALDARHRIAVLGDMLELEDYETTGHERVGRQAARVLDLLVTKGNRARSIADERLPPACRPTRLL